MFEFSRENSLQMRKFEKKFQNGTLLKYRQLRDPFIENSQFLASARKKTDASFPTAGFSEYDTGGHKFFVKVRSDETAKNRFFQIGTLFFRCIFEIFVEK